VDDVNACISTAAGQLGASIRDALSIFVQQNEGAQLTVLPWVTIPYAFPVAALNTSAPRCVDPTTSPNLQVAAEDELTPIIGLLHHPEAEEDEPLLLHALKALKVLSRKFENRYSGTMKQAHGCCRSLWLS